MTSQAHNELPFFQQPDTSSSPPKTMTDVLALPEIERKLMNWLMRRRKAAFTEIIQHLGGDSETAQRIVERLFQAGFISTSEDFEGSKDIILRPKIMSRR
jgi:predicted transcriptional regulator